LVRQRCRRDMAVLLKMLAEIADIDDLVLDAEIGIVETALGYAAEQWKRSAFMEQPLMPPRPRAAALAAAAAGFAPATAFTAADAPPFPASAGAGCNFRDIHISL